MTLDDLTVNFKHLNRDEMLIEWVWLIGDSKLPILLTSSGDAFLQDPVDNTISCLEIATAEMHHIADSVDEFRQLLTEKEFVVNYLGVNMVGDLIQNNVLLQPGQIYSYKKPPILGGDYSLDNMEPIDIEIHFSMHGQLHKQLKSIPAGTKINEIKFS